MTLIEYLKSQASKNTQIGDLAKDAINDRELPHKVSEDEIISYLEYKTSIRGTTGVFKELMRDYKNQKESIADPTNLEINFKPMKSEQWSYLKEHFASDKAITVGKPGQIYRVFGINTKCSQALRFDIYTTRDLDELSILPVSRIYKGELTKEVSLKEAIEALESLIFDHNRQPREPNFSEMMEYLRSQI
ncbi:YozE family protein [Olivibacter jilunii]|uniref:YozE family protein n=1 Tax=Olivibacter jilunii TaxID=985016 RepID=UPI00102FC897|nr:YozE family protein [Olivibacter jilunii]